MFESELELHQEERERRILADTSARRAEWSPPRSWFPPGRLEGFMPSWEAADWMGVPEREVLELAARGHFEYLTRGTWVFVRPAVVSVLAVRDSGSE